jgi:hypothetical protein
MTMRISLINVPLILDRRIIFDVISINSALTLKTIYLILIVWFFWDVNYGGSIIAVSKLYLQHGADQQASLVPTAYSTRWFAAFTLEFSPSARGSMQLHNFFISICISDQSLLIRGIATYGFQLARVISPVGSNIISVSFSFRDFMLGRIGMRHIKGYLSRSNSERFIVPANFSKGLVDLHERTSFLHLIRCQWCSTNYMI